MTYVLIPLFLIAVGEFLLLRAVYRELGEITQENAVNKITIRRLNDQLKISSLPPAKLDDTLKRMYSGDL